VVPAHRLECLAMVICDSIIDDRQTGKKTLVGLFNQIGAHSFPVRHQSLVVYCSLTQGQGKYRIQLQCLHAGKDEPIMGIDGELTMANPLAIAEMGFTLNGIVFPEAGPYEFQIICEGETIGRRRFQVLNMRTQK
jgi:hypothetical protein